jgi:hypothetical protein
VTLDSTMLGEANPLADIHGLAVIKQTGTLNPAVRHGYDIVKDVSKGGTRTSSTLSLVTRVMYDGSALEVGVKARTGSSGDEARSDLSIVAPEVALFSF